MKSIIGQNNNTFTGTININGIQKKISGTISHSRDLTLQERVRMITDLHYRPTDRRAIINNLRIY